MNADRLREIEELCEACAAVDPYNGGRKGRETWDEFDKHSRAWVLELLAEVKRIPGLEEPEAQEIQKLKHRVSRLEAQANINPTKPHPSPYDLSKQEGLRHDA